MIEQNYPSSSMERQKDEKHQRVHKKYTDKQSEKISMYVIWIPKGEKREKWGKGNIWREKTAFCRTNEIYQSTDSKNTTNPKQDT